MVFSVKKFGWVRSENEDFSDDGNRFIVYRHRDFPELRLSKLKPAGDGYYISVRVENDTLTYDELKALPKYRALDRLNCGCELKDGDLEELMEACKEFYSAYKTAKKAAGDIPVELVKAKAKELDEAASDTYEKAKDLVVKNFDKMMSLDDYSSRQILDYLRTLQRRAKSKESVEFYSRSRYNALLYIKKTAQKPEENYYYQCIAEKLTTKE